MPAPADKTDYPTITDLKAWLNAAKVILPSDTVLADKLAAGIGFFESAAGRRVVAVAATFTLPCRGQRKVPLPRSCSEIVSVTVLGTLYTAGIDYDGMSVTGNPPYDWLEFSRPLPHGWQLAPGGGQWARRGLVVVAMEGMGSTVPYAIWSGMLAAACLLTVPEVAAAVSLGRARYEAGESAEYFNIRGDGGPYENEAKYWREQANTGVALARRVTVGAA